VTDAYGAKILIFVTSLIAAFFVAKGFRLRLRAVVAVALLLNLLLHWAGG